MAGYEQRVHNLERRIWALAEQAWEDGTLELAERYAKAATSLAGMHPGTPHPETNLPAIHSLRKVLDSSEAA